MIFASDLDNTLIHSKQHIPKDTTVICVEYIKDKQKPVTYMTPKAISLLNEIALKCQFIPVTAREIKQFKRIFNMENCPYAITSNGAVIFDHGKKIQEWEKIIAKITETESNHYTQITNKLNEYAYLFEKPPRIVDNTVIMTKLLTTLESNHPFIKQLTQYIEQMDWNITIQQKKIYIAPHTISKEKALAFLLNKLKFQTLITAGDGAMDLNFINQGDIRFLPKDSEAYLYITDHHAYHTVTNGPIGTEEMLLQIKQIIEKTNKS